MYINIYIYIYIYIYTYDNKKQQQRQPKHATKLIISNAIDTRRLLDQNKSYYQSAPKTCHFHLSYFEPA